MKKFIPILIAIIVLSFSYQLIINFFITQYITEYSIVGDDNLFDITEKFYSKNNYDFIINDKESDKYIISDKYDFNKQKGVIKDIAYYSDENVKCILPIYKRERIGNISCLYENSQVDYSYLITNNYPTDKMLNKFKKYGYKVDKRIDLDSPTKEYNLENSSSIFVYENNIYENFTYAIWNYNGIFFINKDKTIEKKYFDDDLYDNSNSRIIGKYYMIFDFNDTSLNDIYFVNMEDYGKNSIYLKNGLHNNMYINGVYNNKLYITDLKDKVEYALNPYKADFEIVGQDKEFLILNNNELQKISKKDYFSSKYYFNSINVEKINKKFGNVDIIESGNYYYFMKDNIFYKQNKDYSGLFIKLFKFDEVTDWKVVDNDIIFTVGDTLYLFTERYGIKPIARNNEFKYNYKNICNLYKKS